MPNALCDILLERINGYGEGCFTIVDEEELLSLFGPASAVTGEEVRTMLSSLRDRRLIDMQYAEEGTYCVRPLPAGRLYFEEKRENAAERGRRRRDALLFSAVGSFTGGLLGALIGALLLLLRC